MRIKHHHTRLLFLVMSEIPYFDSVPNETLLHIIQYTDQKTLLSLHRVCRRFRINMPIQDISLYVYDSQVDIPKILDRFKSKTCSLYVKKLIDIFDLYMILHDLINEFTYIKYVDFSCCPEVDDDYFRYIDSSTHFSITERIQSINLSGCKNITNSTTNKFKNENCAYLDLSYCTQLEKINYGKRQWNFEDNKKNFGTINLTGCTGLDPDSLYSLRKVRCIILDGCTQISDEDLIKLIESYRSSSGYMVHWEPIFDAISLKGCTKITGKFIWSFPSNDKVNICSSNYIKNVDDDYDICRYVCIEDCKNIRYCYLRGIKYIDISDCNYFTKEVFSYLERCKKIIMKNCTFIDDKCFSFLKKAHYVDITGCPNVSTNGLLQLESCQTLVLSKNNPNIDYDTITKRFSLVLV